MKKSSAKSTSTNCLALVAFMAGVSAFGQTTYNAANGPTNSDTWNTAGNWSFGIPGGAVDVIIDGFAVARSTTTPAYTGNLTLNNNRTLKVWSNAADKNAYGTGTITMNAGSQIIMRHGAHNVTQPITLLGNARVATGESTTGHHTTKNFDSIISGGFGFTISGVNNNTINLNQANTFSSLTTDNTFGSNFRVHGTVVGSLGTGDVTIGPSSTLFIDVANAMASTGTLTLNGGRDTKLSAAFEKLHLSANQTVNELFIDGVQAPAGTYMDADGTWISGGGTLTVSSGPVNIPPTLASSDIVDDVFGGPIYEDFAVVTYTLTFSEDMDPATVTAADFENGGTAPGTIGTVTKTVTGPLPTSPSVFTVEFLPSGTGTLQLQVKMGAVLQDTTGMPLDTSSPIPDDTTITILAGNTPPATITGTTGGNDSWNIGGNWDTGSVPFGPGSAIVDAGVVAQVNNASTPSYTGSLTLLANSTLRINGTAGSIGVLETPSSITLNDGSRISVATAEDPNFPPVVLAGNATIDNPSNAGDHDSRFFDGAITGTGDLTIVGRNNQLFEFNANNTFTGNLIFDAVDRYRVEANTAGALGTGNVTVNPRANADGRSAVLIINADDAMADTATLSLNGNGYAGSSGSFPTPLQMNANDTICGLVVNGVDQGFGTFTSATHPTLISGNGTLTVMPCVAAVGPEPFHRFSFCETMGNTIMNTGTSGGPDAIRVIVGAQNSVHQCGSIRLDGGPKNAADFIQLPNGITDASPRAFTIEIWATPHSVQNWSRIVDLGFDSNRNLLMAWTQGTNFNTDRTAIKNGGGTEQNVNNNNAPYTLDEPVHVALTVQYNGLNDTRLDVYKNGVFTDGFTSTHDPNFLIGSTQNFLGRSQYNDSGANATYDEFRLYTQVLTPQEIADSFAAGPDAGYSSGAWLPDLEVGCIAHTNQIPPPDFIGAGLFTGCVDAAATFIRTQALSAVLASCESGFERVYSLQAACGTSVVTQAVTYLLNTAPPEILSVAPYTVFGCDWETDPGARARIIDDPDVHNDPTYGGAYPGFAATDPDGDSTLLPPEHVVTYFHTNECLVTVERWWRVTDCCSNRHEFMESFQFPVTGQSVANAMLGDLQLGCISTLDQIPPPDFIEAGTDPSCGELAVTYLGTQTLIASISDLALWLDASDVDGDGTPDALADGSLITSWQDKSGNGRHADDVVQGSPFYVASSPAGGGAPAIGFSTAGGEDQLATTFNFDALGSDYTIIAVSRYAGANRRRVISSASRNWLFGHHGNRDDRWYAGGWIEQGDTTTDQDFHVYSGVIGPSVNGNVTNPGADFWKDGVQLEDNNTGSHDTNYKPGRLSFGDWTAANNNESSDAEVAEVIVYDRALTDEERLLVEAYLTRKYNLASAADLPCETRLARRYEVSTACHTTEVTQVVSYTLAERTQITAVAPHIDYACGEIPRTLDQSMAAVVAVNASNISLLRESTANLGCVSLVTRTWLATGCCGFDRWDETFTYPNTLTNMLADLNWEATVDIGCTDPALLTDILGCVTEPTGNIYSRATSLTDPDFAAGTSLDGWNSIMSIQESYNYMNPSPVAQTLSVKSWDYDVHDVVGRVTPFIVRLNDINGNGNLLDDNNFTVLWIGQTAVAGVDYIATGPNSSDLSGSFVLQPGETAAIGFLNSNADGSATVGAVISYGGGITGGGMWFNGNPGADDYPHGTPGGVGLGGTLTGVPILENRSYNFGINFVVLPSADNLIESRDNCTGDLVYRDGNGNTFDALPDDFELSGDLSLCLDEVDLVRTQAVSAGVVIPDCREAFERVFEFQTACEIRLVTQVVFYASGDSDPVITKVEADADHGCQAADFNPSSLAFVSNGIPMPAEGLIAHYPLDEVSGNIVDAVGGQIGVPNGSGHTYNRPGPLGYGCAVGFMDAGAFRVSSADSAELNALANDFTVSSWVYLNPDITGNKSGTSSTLNRIIGSERSGGNGAWSLGVFADGTLRFTKLAIIDIDTAAGLVPAGQWAHVLVTVSSSGGVDFYVDGVLVASSGNTSNNAATSSPFEIGRSFGAGEQQWFGGDFDEIRVYNRVVDAGEIQLLSSPLAVLQESRTTNGCEVVVQREYFTTDCCGNIANRGTRHTFTIKPSQATVAALADIDMGCVSAPGAVGQPRQVIHANGNVTLQAGSDFYAASNASDGGTGSGSGDLYVTDAPGGGSADYFAVNGIEGDPVLIIDLGADQALAGAQFWNYPSFALGNAAAEFSLRFATAAEGPTGFGSTIFYNPTFHPLSLGNTIAQDFFFSQSVTARYIEMTLTDNYFEDFSGGDRVGFADIQFVLDGGPPYAGLPAPTDLIVDAMSSCAISDIRWASDYFLGTTGCVSSNERIYVVVDACGAENTVIQTIRYIQNLAGPVITNVAPYVDYGCEGDQRPLADSLSQVMYTGADPIVGETVVQPNGRFIMVQNNGPTSRRMDIGEIEAFAPGAALTSGNAGGNAATDYAIGPAASIHSEGVTSGTFSQPHGATDDDDDLIDGMETGGGNTWSSQGIGNFVIIDLGASRDIGTVRVHQRSDSCCDDRLQNFTMSLLADDGTGNPGAVVQSVSFPGQPASGSFAQADFTATVIPGPSLEAEVRVTNDCQVTVYRTWRVEDCCGDADEALEIYSFNMDIMEIANAALGPLEVGCIANENQIPPPDFIAAGTFAQCGSLSIRLVNTQATSAVLENCESGYERVYLVSGTCEQVLVTQIVTYVLNSGPPQITNVAPTVDYGCAGDQRSVADSMAQVMYTDPDGDDTVGIYVAPSGRFVMVQNNGTESRRMDIGEIEAFAPGAVLTSPNAGGNAGTATDYAIGPGASIHSEGVTSGGFSQPHGATNDDDDLLDGAETGGGNTWSSQGIGNFVIIDLGATVPVGTIRVHQRSDSCCDDRLRDFTMSLLADDGTGNPGAVVASFSYPAQPPSGLFAEASFDQVFQSGVVTLVSESRTTNDCQVTVTRTWRVEDCCGSWHEADEVYSFIVPPEPPEAARYFVYVGCIDDLDAVPGLEEATLEPLTNGCEHLELAWVSNSPPRDVPFPDFVLPVDWFEAIDPGLYNQQTNGCLTWYDRVYSLTDLCGQRAAVTQTVAYTLDQYPPRIVSVSNHVDYGCSVEDPRPVATSLTAIVVEHAEGPYWVSGRDGLAAAAPEPVTESRFTNDCFIQVFRTWRVVDCCGSYDEALETYSYIQQIDDLTVEPLAPLHLECINNREAIPLPEPDLVQVSAMCPLQSVEWAGDSMETNLGGCTSMFIRSYQAVDNCGATATVTQVVTYIVDQLPPVIESWPADTNLGCQALMPDPVPVANLTNDLVVSDDSLVTWRTNDDSRVTNGCEVTVTRRWVIRDCCGRLDERATEYTFTILPDAVSIDALADKYIGCITHTNQLPEPNVTLINASSACSVVTLDYLGEQNPTHNGCTSSVDRVYQATDLCGQTNTITQTVSWTLEPDQPEILAWEAGQHWDCQTNGWRVPADTNALVVTNVSGEATWTDVYSTNGCTVTLRRTWRVENCCWFTTVDSYHTFTLRPDAATVEALAPLHVGCIRDIDQVPQPNETILSVSSACNVADIFFVSNAVATVSGCSSSYQRVYGVEDICGQSSYVTQEIRWVLEPGHPEILRVEGSADWSCRTNGWAPPVDTNAFAATGYIGQVSISEVSTTNGCLVILQRTFEVANCCGDTDHESVLHTWTLRPAPPVMLGLELIDLGCIADTSAVPDVDAGSLEVISACSEVDLVYLTNTPATQVTECVYELTRTFRATDTCGQSVDFVRTIRYRIDTIAPAVLSLPGGYLGCSSAGLPPTNLPTHAEDEAAMEIVEDCESIVTLIGERLDTNDPCRVELVRTYRIQDACDHFLSERVTYTWTEIGDAPVISGPARLGLGCINSTASIPPPSTTPFSVRGSCEIVEFGHTNDSAHVLSTNQCVLSFDRVYFARDLCGQESFYTQTVFYTLLSRPEIIETETGADLGCVFGEPDLPTAIVSVVYVGNVPGGPTVTSNIVTNGCERTLTRNYRIEDCCGDSDETSVQFTWTAGPDPATIDGPMQLDIGCIESRFGIPRPDASDFTVNANCDAVIQHAGDGPLSTNGCTISFLRTYNLVDVCNRTNQFDQTITYSLRGPHPDITSVPAGQDFGCLSAAPDIPADSNAVSWVGTNIELSYSDVYRTNGCEVTLTRTWRADNCCGDFDEAAVVYTWIQPSPPVLTPPVGFIFEDDLGCNPDFSNLPLIDVTRFEVESSCGATARVYHASDERVFSGCTGTLIRTYTASDTCGNYTSVVQTFTFTVDTQAPTNIAVNAGGDLPCGMAVPAPDVGLVSVGEENCPGEVEISVDSVSTARTVCAEVITHTYRVADACGNDRLVSVHWNRPVDDEAPVLTCPDPVEVETGVDCYAPVPEIVPDWTDNCGEVTVSQVPKIGTTLPGPSTQEVTVTVSDACGNSTSCVVQLIINSGCGEGGYLIPDVAIDKRVALGSGVDCATAVEKVSWTNGAAVTWCFRITNTGQVELQNVQLSDPLLGVSQQIAGSLAAGQNTGWIAIDGTIAGSHINTATVTGLPVNGRPPVSAADDAEVEEIAPPLELLKTVRLGTPGDGGQCPGVELVEGFVGDAVVYCFEIRNNGQTVIDNVRLRDDQLGIDLEVAAQLASGQSVFYSAASTIGGALTNTAWASGRVPTGPMTGTVANPDTAVVDLGAARIAGVVWEDARNDGFLDESLNLNLEVLGLVGVDVCLYEVVGQVEEGRGDGYGYGDVPGGRLIRTATTGSGGSYEFDGLPAGDYFVEVHKPTVALPSGAPPLPTTAERFETTLVRGDDKEGYNFGFREEPTAVRLTALEAVLGEGGVVVQWTAGSQSELLGYRVSRKGEVISPLIPSRGAVGTYGYTVVGATGGRYTLEAVGIDLEAEALGSALTQVDAAPQGEPSATVQAESNQAVFTSEAGVTTYFVYEFDTEPTVTDLTHERELKGQVIEVDGKYGVYFSPTAGAEIQVR